MGGARSDPTFNRLARLLAKADTQFEAVNPARAELNILAYVNHDDSSHYGDLIETITGCFHAGDGTKHPTMMHIADGWIGEAKQRTDAFLWFESGTGRMIGAVINDTDPERLQRFCALLDIDPKKIRS